ncbi:TIGR01777 family oxidoreductase [Priestia taiwanensis]|uniref:Epimerase n=1 Tax=Priestia taiwanensis TaxID=1347902 RepID=A0A917AV20_9BACI|nr:TIGR01777 family oxidoreductase [Priestia taiwanensis]MBM7364636.1 uncharacterized protein (TIGR01777 family) [Priestia taiwanensis]GGE78404.1 epimerase [Priestia taiwanensis]
MNVLLAGGTGFVGKHLTNALLKENHTIYILTRNKSSKEAHTNVHYIQWEELHTLSTIHVVVNVAGDPLNEGRWTEAKKARILSSRLQTTQQLVSFVEKAETKPDVFINASAVGFYGTSLTHTFTEDTDVSGHDFLARTVVAWEKEATKVKKMGIRTVFARFGVIFGRDEGALPRIVLPYRFFVGGTIGSGKQWVSWIHINDAVNLLLYAMDHEKIEGPLNVTAPYPATMKQVGQSIGAVLSRPHWLPVPRACLQLLLGEMSTLVIDGQKVLPKKALTHGFTFQYPHVKDALQHLLE